MVPGPVGDETTGHESGDLGDPDLDVALRVGEQGDDQCPENRWPDKSEGNEHDVRNPPLGQCHDEHGTEDIGAEADHHRGQEITHGEARR